MSGHLAGVPGSGRAVVRSGDAAQDEVVPLTATAPERVASGGTLRPDLEEFWPSRRGHAYDELCR